MKKRIQNAGKNHKFQSNLEFVNKKYKNADVVF